MRYLITKNTVTQTYGNRTVVHDNHGMRTDWFNYRTGICYSERTFIFIPVMPALNITIVNATDLRETEFLGNKQDPYVIIRSDCENCKTVTHMDGGKNPGLAAFGV